MSKYKSQHGYALIKTDPLDAEGWKNLINIIENDFARRDGAIWQKGEFRPKPQESLELAAKFFDNINGEIIIEIGSGLHGLRSGNSALVWKNNTKAKEIICVDKNEHRISQIKECADLETPRVKAITQDGISLLSNYQKKISLLYLDFWAKDRSKKSGLFASEYLEAYECVRNKMRKTSMILIDDTDHFSPWKQTEIVPRACGDGFRVNWVGRQTLLVREK